MGAAGVPPTAGWIAVFGLQDEIAVPALSLVALYVAFNGEVPTAIRAGRVDHACGSEDPQSEGAYEPLEGNTIQAREVDVAMPAFQSMDDQHRPLVTGDNDGPELILGVGAASRLVDELI